jgi:hypothetical protein
MQNRYFFHDIQSQARAFFPAVGTLERKKFIKDLLQGEIGNPCAVIFDPANQLDRTADRTEIDESTPSLI